MPITFHDVAIYFLEEEWKSLEEEQKELYKDIMMENHQTLLSLGYLRKKPKIISAIERGEEPYVKSDQNKKKLKNTVPGNKVVTSNNQEESLSSHCTTEDKNNLDSLTEQISRSPINTRKERNCISRSYGQSVISRRIHMYNVCVCL
ncbi:zinc finger protein 334-like [Rhinophrynus dorsalis]